MLISRLYRPDVRHVVIFCAYSPYPYLHLRRTIADVFRIQVISSSEVRSPIVTLGSTSFFHVKVNNVYVVAVTKYEAPSSYPNGLIHLWNRNNANAALVFEFCYRVITICKSYFGKVDEECVKNNFVLIYELIDGGSLLTSFDVD